jgi:hypothetical protein
MKTNIHISSYLAQFFLDLEMFRRKILEKNRNTHFVFSNFFSFPENRAVYEIMWKNSVEACMPQMTIRRMHIACWIPKATNTHPEYIIVIALPLRQWLHERALIVRNTYIAYLAPPPCKMSP